MPINERYARQMQLPLVGKEGQQRIQKARILVVGAGGLGVPVLQYLAGAGIGFIRILDDDVVELSNLHRQPIYASYLGQAKVRAAQSFIQQLNPEVEVEALKLTLCPSQVSACLQDVDAVLDCADSYAVSYVLSDACLQAKKPLISASALETRGYVGGFCGTAPSLRAVFPAPANKTATCASAGVLGPVVAMLGMLQAQMLLTLLLQNEATPLVQSPLGQMLMWDMQGWRMSAFRFDQAQEPKDIVFRFIDTKQLTPQDLVLDVLELSDAELMTLVQSERANKKRLVLTCTMGVKAWRMAEKIAPLWQGDIALMAARLER